MTYELLFIGTMELFIILVPIIFYVAIIYNITKNKYLNYNQKLLWILVVLIANIIGALIYWIWGRKPNNIK